MNKIFLSMILSMVFLLNAAIFSADNSKSGSHSDLKVMIGTVIGMDTGNNTISVKDINGNIYVFKLKRKMIMSDYMGYTRVRIIYKVTENQLIALRIKKVDR